MLSRVVWEQHNGPIPPKQLVKYKDGDRSNCVIENLYLQSMRDNARENRMWNPKNMPRELAEVIQLTGALKRKLRKYGEEQNQ